ncbi:divergent paired-related homeobox [Monodon monoceros]|uniref:divergent paired-related homeobox n=1 Tax=Monodon monoceros TaxID=40151 RepID=UPI0010F9882E|nr:divergent paired-related homeobox [Monodon monoceros]
MEAHLDYRVSDPDDLSKGKYRKHPKRKRTMFMRKHLADLNFLFNKNPYPTPSLQREMASKMDIHPTVLQVWFKNLYMDRPIPSFQLSRWRNLKAVTDHSLGHKMVHFGYCQDPNICCLYPILGSQALSTSFNSNPFGSFSP